jgi:hypothetical protein
LKTIVRALDDLKLEYPELNGNMKALIQEVKENVENDAVTMNMDNPAIT